MNKPNLKGLSEPWARDEQVYNKRFDTWSDFNGHYDLIARRETIPERVREHELRKVDYMDRWNNKFTDISARNSGRDVNRYDGDPFT